MKSPAKINIFLKITGMRGAYHELCSRFVRVENLHDEIEFIDGNFGGFTIKSNIEISNNILHKVYARLCEAGFERTLSDFFATHAVSLNKQIPLGGGLGGGSSNAATLLLMLNSELNLGISRERLIAIAKSIGADVPFFVAGFASANVSGIGEIIEPFDDRVPPLEIATKGQCDTARVYGEFRARFMDTIDRELAARLVHLPSDTILSEFANLQLNDLLAPANALYALNLADDEFLSGSGGSYFKVKK